MAKILVGVMAGIVVTLFIYMLSSLSSDARGLAIGVVFGVLAGVPSALLVLASSRRNQRPYDVDDYKEGYHTIERFDQRYGDRDLPPYPYQPPVIVLAAPVEQPQVVNYTDNRSVTIHKPVSSVPSIYDRQRQVAAEQGRKEVQRVGHNGQGARVFRAVGEREEWDE